MSGGAVKRRAEVPQDVYRIGERVSKADLLEAAYHLASLCGRGEGCDDESAAIARLIEELNTIRANQGRRALKTE